VTLAGERSRRYFGLVGRFVRFAGVAGLVLIAGSGCRAKDPTITAPFRDDFERAELGPSWKATGPEYHISGGKLSIANAYNHPAWLRRKLPRDVVIEMDAVSRSPAGDIKIELYGDGESFDPDKGGYTSTGYVLIFGGWHNSLSVICRNNEHDDGRKAQRTTPAVEPGRTYRFTVTRRGGAIDWKIDGQPFLSWVDPTPLMGEGHEYLAVNDWESDVSFDNLEIRPETGTTP
jgi:Farnesoic acid 0-methyl transferase